MIKNYLLISVISLSLIILGCASQAVKTEPSKTLKDAQKSSETAGTTLDSFKLGLYKQSDSIKLNAGKIIDLSDVTDKTIADIQKDIDSNYAELLKNSLIPGGVKSIQQSNTSVAVAAHDIKRSADEIDKLKIQLDSSIKIIKDLSGTLRKTVVQVEKLQRNNKAQATEITKLKSDNQKLLNYCLTGMIVIGVLAIVGASVIFFMSSGANSRLAMIVGVAGLTMMIASAAVMAYFQYLALVGLIVGGAGVVAILYAIIHQVYFNKKVNLAVVQDAVAVNASLQKTVEEVKKDNAVTNTALKETVATVEAVKTLIPEPAKKDFFGEGALPGKVSQIQSGSTVNKVLNIREGMKKHWEPTIKLK